MCAVTLEKAAQDAAARVLRGGWAHGGDVNAAGLWLRLAITIWSLNKDNVTFSKVTCGVTDGPTSAPTMHVLYKPLASDPQRGHFDLLEPASGISCGHSAGHSAGWLAAATSPPSKCPPAGASAEYCLQLLYLLVA